MFKISLETKILLIISLLDCIISASLFHFNLAFEVNPLMTLFLKFGLWYFIIAKMGISVILISILELFRHRHFGYIKFYQRMAILFYLGLLAFAPPIYLILERIT